MNDTDTGMVKMDNIDCRNFGFKSFLLQYLRVSIPPQTPKKIMKNKGRLRVLRILVLFAIGKKHLLTVVSEMVNWNLVRKNELDGKEQRAR